MRTILFVAIALFVFISPSGGAHVYVYEVVTKDTTFQTASKLHPDSFLMYNGGEDVILRLTVLKIYADKEFEQALEDYGLQSKNVRYMPHEANAGSDNRSRVPFYWWR
ncbi:MAG: hypothetical protein LBD73_09030 [Deferribacteraceae bacterium]|jgi:hypothetical protein|nr:hypothetical protein [Deferribacteraceae bacterium]